MKKTLLLISMVFLTLVSAMATGPFRDHRWESFHGLKPTTESIVFVGNSITNMHDWWEAFGDNHKILNRGVSGGFTYEVLPHLEMIAMGRPDKVFIGIGTNDLCTVQSIEATADNIRIIAERLRRESPNTKVYVQSVIPSTNSNGFGRGERIPALNTIVKPLIEKLNEQLGEVYYLDVFSQLVAADGVSFKKSSAGLSLAYDNLHPNVLGYGIWCKFIAPQVGSECIYNTSVSTLYHGNQGNNSTGDRITCFAQQVVNKDDILIIGDEMVSSGEWHEWLKSDKVKNRGLGWGYTGSNIDQEITNASIYFQNTKSVAPKAIVIYAGVQEAHNKLTAANFKTKYKSLIDGLRNSKAKAANTTIYLLSPLRTPNSEVNGYIDQYQSVLAELASANTNVKVIDATSMNGTTKYFYQGDGGNYLTSYGYAKISQIIAEAINADFPGSVSAVTDEECKANNELYAARKVLGDALTDALRLSKPSNVGSGIGQYSASNLEGLNTKIEEAFTLMRSGTATATQLQNMATILTAVTPTLNAVTPEAVIGKQFYLRTPNRGNRYAIGGNGTMDRADNYMNYSSYRWVFVPRQDGSYDIKNLGTNTYADPTTGYDSHMALTANAPQKGWNFKANNATGTYAIYSEAAELNMSNNSNMWVYNWYDKNNFPDLNDTGCQFAIIEAEGEPEDPKGLDTDEAWTIRAVFSSGAATRYLVNNNGSLAAVTEAPTTTAGHWVVGNDYVQSVADSKYLGVNGGFYLSANKVTIAFSEGKTAGTQSIGEVASNGTRNGALKSDGTVTGGQFTNGKQNEYNGWSSDFIIEKVGGEGDNNKEHEGPYTIDKLNGDLYRDGSTTGQNWNNTWKSKDTPQLLFTASANNMTWSGNNLQIESGQAGSSAYTLTAPAGYIIKSFSFDFAAKTAGKTVTLSTLQENYTTSTTPQTISKDNYGRKSFNFSVSGTNGNSTILTKFIVEIEKGEEPEDLSGYKVFDNAGSQVPYRIPAVAKNQNGDLIFVTDYRYSKADIGMSNNGKLDLRYRIKSADGTWSEVMTLAKCIESPTFTAFGDPCIVADRESNRVMVTSCCGNVSFPNGTHSNHQGWARFYSEDGGKNWGKHTDIADQVFTQLDKRSDGQIRCFFIGSGKISQSKTVKVGTYYRLYCAALVKTSGNVNVNYVFYSDDFGMNWNLLGTPNDCPIPSGDEPKADELPDGSILVSSRVGNGRHFNIYHFTDVKTGAGSWGTSTFSTSTNNNGVLASSNACNGEIMIVPVVRASDKVETHLLLQSAPFGPGSRINVGINYKDLTDKASYATPAAIAADWTGRYQVSMTTSAYSTMCMDKDDNIAFFYEENNYNNGYDMIYKTISIDELTGGKYSVLSENTEGIASVEQISQRSATTYDLQGRQVQKAQRGLYIENGRKIIR